MRLSVIGCGYLGTVHAAAMTSIGHEVVGIDIDADRVRSLQRGEAPFYEPGLPEILAEGVSSGRLSFTTDMSAARGAAVHFVGVGTPQQKGGYAADLTHVDAAIDGLLPHLSAGDVVAGKSTVPVGTAAVLAERVHGTGATLVWNPEFLREGFAVRDTVDPDRVVVGVPPDESGERAAAIVREVYSPSVAKGTPFMVTDYATAELVKVAANAFLATKISFINAMAEIAEVTGADVTQLADAIGHDVRIGRRFLGAGIGFGGGCLPKDIRAFSARAEELGRGESVAFLREVDAINLRRRERAVQLVVDGLGGPGGPAMRSLRQIGACCRFPPVTPPCTRSSPDCAGGTPRSRLSTVPRSGQEADDLGTRAPPPAAPYPRLPTKSRLRLPVTAPRSHSTGPVPTRRHQSQPARRGMTTTIASRSGSSG